MESGNSSSMQSSSGGDEEYNSRADQSLSAILDHHHNHNHHAGGPMPNPPPPPPPQNHLLHHHYHQTHFDNPLISNFFINNPLSPSSSSSRSLLNINPAVRQDLPGFIATSASPHPPVPRQHFLNQTHQQEVLQNINTTNNNNSNNSIGVMTRNRKKRSRASRRAPTTVLTTDTSNFRAMVQEFTGIPGPLFPTNTHTSTRLSNLFGFPSSPTSSLLRPLAQKMIIPPSFLASTCSSSSSSDHYQTLNLQNLLQAHPPKDLVSSLSPFLYDKSNQTNHPKTTAHHSPDDFGLGCLQSITQSTNDKNDDPGDDSTRHINGVYNEIGVMPSASSSFHDKGPQNVTATRNEGMVESWICSSDQGI